MPAPRFVPFPLLSQGPLFLGSDTTQLSNGRSLPARATNRRSEALAANVLFAPMPSISHDPSVPMHMYASHIIPLICTPSSHHETTSPRHVHAPDHDPSHAQHATHVPCAHRLTSCLARIASITSTQNMPSHATSTCITCLTRCSSQVRASHRASTQDCRCRETTRSTLSVRQTARLLRQMRDRRDSGVLRGLPHHRAEAGSTPLQGHQHLPLMPGQLRLPQDRLRSLPVDHPIQPPTCSMFSLSLFPYQAFLRQPQQNRLRARESTSMLRLHRLRLRGPRHSQESFRLCSTSWTSPSSRS